MEPSRLLYVVVQDPARMDLSTGRGDRASECSTSASASDGTFYTRQSLVGVLQLMGCKHRHAFKISEKSFRRMEHKFPLLPLKAGGPSQAALPAEFRERQGRVHVKDEGRRPPSPGKKDHRSMSPVGRNGFHLSPEEPKRRHGSPTCRGSRPTSPGVVSAAHGRCVRISRDAFLDVVCKVLSEYKYRGGSQRADLALACSVKERKLPVIVLLCGTSGCGKSTLASLLASRLGITTVVSTDSIRHMMRGFSSAEENPLIWASTYHAGECLDLAEVLKTKKQKKEAKAAQRGKHKPSLVGVNTEDSSSHSPPIKGGCRDADRQQASTKSMHTLSQRDNMQAGSALNQKEALLTGKENRAMVGGPGEDISNDADPPLSPPVHLPGSAAESPGIDHEVLRSESSRGTCSPDVDTVTVSEREMVVEGYKAQSALVVDAINRLLTKWERGRTSAIIEGVHLSINLVMDLMKKHPSVMPFLIYISNETKHLERFAVRAKFMTLEASQNKYVKYLKNIRTIQDYLLRKADKHLVPKVNNTNVDRSVAAIHGTVFACLRHIAAGDMIHKPGSRSLMLLHREYQSQYAASGFSSKGMFEVLQRRLSSQGLEATPSLPEGSSGTDLEKWEKTLQYNQPPLYREEEGEQDDEEEMSSRSASDGGLLGEPPALGIGLNKDTAQVDSDKGRSLLRGAVRMDTPRKLPGAGGFLQSLFPRLMAGKASQRHSGSTAQGTDHSTGQVSDSPPGPLSQPESSIPPNPSAAASSPDLSSEAAPPSARATPPPVISLSELAAQAEKKRWTLFFESIPLPPSSVLEASSDMYGQASAPTTTSPQEEKDLEDNSLGLLADPQGFPTSESGGAAAANAKSWTEGAQLDSDNEEEHKERQEDDQGSGSGSDDWSQATEVGEKDEEEEDEASVVETASSSDWSEDMRSDSMKASEDWRLPGESGRLKPVLEGVSLDDDAVPEMFFERHRSLGQVFEDDDKSPAKGRAVGFRDALTERSLERGRAWNRIRCRPDV